MKNQSLFALVITLLLCMAATTDIVAQCAMCSKVAESDMHKGHTPSVSKNINMAILYLMAIPYLALAIYFRKQLISLYKSMRPSKKPAVGS